MYNSFVSTNVYREYKYSVLERKKEDIWLSPTTKPPTPTENSIAKRQQKDATKIFDHIMIADRIKTASLSNHSHPNSQEEKREDLAQSYDKSPYTYRKDRGPTANQHGEAIKIIM